MMNVDLHEELEIECMDAINGDPPGPAVAKRLERVVTAVLRSHHITFSKIIAQSDRNGTTVQILLPKPDKTVQQIVLKMH